MRFRRVYLVLAVVVMGGCPDERKALVQETPPLEPTAKPVAQVEQVERIGAAVANEDYKGLAELPLADSEPRVVAEQQRAEAPANDQQGTWEDSLARAELYEAEAETCTELEDWACALSKLRDAFELRAKLTLEPFEACDTAQYPGCLSEIESEVEAMRKGLPTGNLANCITFPDACSQYSSEQLVALSSLSALANRRSYNLYDLRIHADSLSQSALRTPRPERLSALDGALAAWKVWTESSRQSPPKALLRRLNKMARNERSADAARLRREEKALKPARK